MKINYIFLIMAFGLGCGSYFFAMKTTRIINQGHKVEARVIELSEGSTTDSKGRHSVVYHPVFKYVLFGKNYTQRSSVGTNPPTFNIGEKTHLYIDPEDPSSFISNSYFDKWGITSILGLLSFVFIMISYFIGRKPSGVRTVKLKGKGRFNIVIAEVISITKNENNVYWFEATWTDPMNGRSYIFSINDYYHPTEVFKGKQIEVAMNPKNYAEYYPILKKAPSPA